ncbi:MAG: methyltransferase domain-containing protein [Candidatus Parcubacteria bacterium]|nr:methyltransferase domain-containing protein [Candidatus Parcubacteria bacterium]
MTKWDKFFDEKIREIAKEKIIRDIGGGVAFKKGLAGYEDIFKGKDYKILDYNPKYHPDILGDIHNLPFEDESVDAIICKQVLQCALNPNKACEEIYRVLKKGGKCYVEVPFLYCFWCNGTCEDYYRFTEKGLRYLFRKFSSIEICPIRGHLETIANLFPYQNKFPVNVFVRLARLMDTILEKYQSKKQVSGFRALVIK